MTRTRIDRIDWHHDLGVMFPLWYSPLYTGALDPEARFPRERYDRVRAGLLASGEAARNLVLQDAWEPATVDDLTTVHDATYVDRFLAGRMAPDERRRIGLQPWTEAIVDRTLVLTQGTVSATRRALETGGIAGNLGGGTHHAYHDFGSGYCIFNDLAVAARVARRDHGVRRVLILDLDVHQGDGTAALFADAPDVRTVSFHCQSNFPARKTISDHDEPFADGTNDNEYLSVLHAFLATEPQRFQPDLLFYQAGVDGLATDRLGRLALTRDGLRRRNQLVFDFAAQLAVPVVVTMGGGYGEPLETSVQAHVDVFLQAAEHGRRAS